MDNQTLFAKTVESIKQARKSLEASERLVEQIGKSLGIESEKIDALVKSYGKTHIEENEDVQIIEGIFDGQRMQGPDGKEYPVPANYASKSKLVTGDRLKLTIAENGAFIYKQIEPSPRRMLVGNLVQDGTQFQVIADGAAYNVLYASVTFFRAEIGDQVTIILPLDGTAEWAAIENVIPASEAEELIV